MNLLFSDFVKILRSNLFSFKKSCNLISLTYKADLNSL